MPNPFLTAPSYSTSTVSGQYLYPAWSSWSAWSTTGTQYTQAVWQSWQTVTTTQTYSQYVDNVWGYWMGVGVNSGAVTVAPTSSEELARLQQESNAVQAERFQRRDMKRRRARTRARHLLWSMLSEEQRAEAETNDRFFVTGSRGRRYCINMRGQSGNVSLYDDTGRVQARLCAHPTGPHDDASFGSLVDEDAWLAQMLHLMADEDRFLRTANVHAGHLPPLEAEGLVLSAA